MTPIQVIFIVTSTLMLGAAVQVVTRKNLVHSALYLILAFFGTAVIFVLLEAGYLATVQILVNIGAIAILMVIVVMLSNQVTNEIDPFSKHAAYALAGVFVVFSGFVVIVGSLSSANATVPIADTTGTIEALGIAFFSADGYVIPTMTASILLLAALIGAIFVAWRRNEVEE